MACPERGKPAKNVYFINRPQKQDKLLRRLYGKRSAYQGIAALDVGFFMCCAHFPKQKDRKTSKRKPCGLSTLCRV